MSEIPDFLLARMSEGAEHSSYVIPAWEPRLAEADQKLSDIDPNYVIRQIKDKFGGIRFYVTLSNNADLPTDQSEKFYQAVHDAERDINKICWTCGSSDDVGGNPPYFNEPICRKCSEKEGREFVTGDDDDE